MILLIDEKGNSYLVGREGDFHTKYGMLKKSQLRRKAGSVVESNTRHKFRILPPDFTDFFRKAKRGPQAVGLKDAAMVAAMTGIKSGSRVVDSGVGSGLLSMYLAHIVAPANVTAYEVREDFAEIARKNFERFGVKNVKIKLASVYDGIREKKLDLVSLDVPEPWLAVDSAKKSLRVGGYVSSYSPSIEQNKKFVDALADCFLHETFETMYRSWKMDTLRPNTRMLGHTGFITIARYLG